MNAIKKIQVAYIMLTCINMGFVAFKVFFLLSGARIRIEGLLGVLGPGAEGWLGVLGTRC